MLDNITRITMMDKFGLIILVTGCLPVYSQWLSIAPSDTTAIQGNQTTIHCEVIDNLIPTDWYEYVTDSHGVSIFNSFGDPIPDQPFAIQGEYNLVIQSLELSYGGEYGCQQIGMTSPAIAKLVILSWPSMSIPDLVEGVETTVGCQAEYGGPRPHDIEPSHLPNLRMYVNGMDQNLVPELIEGHPPQDGQTFMASILTLSFNYTPIIEHNGDEVTCRIETITPAMSLTSSETLEILYPVRDMVIYPIKSTYLIGEEINCTADGSGDVDISWTPMTSPQPYFPEGTAVTILDTMVGENTWKCTATNNVMGTQVLENEISFIVENEQAPDSGGGGGAEEMIHCSMLLVVSTLSALLL